MPSITGRRADDRALEHLLGEAPVRCQPVRWGFDASTQVVILASGRRVVMQTRDAGLGTSHALAIDTAERVLRAAGIEVPRLVGAATSEARELLVYELVPGRPGPELLGDPVRGPALASAMGRLARSLAAVTAPAIATDAAWAAPGTLRDASEAWLARLGEDEQLAATLLCVHAGRTGVVDAVPGTIADVARAAVDQIAESPWAAVVSHGDYVPANVLVADDGSLTLLDLGGLASRHPALDVAWWALIVRHHHAELALPLIEGLRARTWPSGAAPTDRLLASVSLLRALQLAVERAPDSGHRRHQLDLAASAVSWFASMPEGG